MASRGASTLKIPTPTLAVAESDYRKKHLRGLRLHGVAAKQPLCGANFQMINQAIPAAGLH
jgi:hypothetical protein